MVTDVIIFIALSDFSVNIINRKPRLYNDILIPDQN